MPDVLIALRPWLGWAVVVGVLLAAWLGTGERARAQDAGDSIARGAELYAVNCAACHGPRGEGGPPVEGLRAGPPLQDLPVAYADQQMRTGRMPIADRASGVVLDDAHPLPDDEREAILDWMVDRVGLTGSIPQVGEGDASRGQELYTFHCAACHGSVGNGGISGSGVLVLGLRGVDPIAIVEATRVGPYDMPAFDTDLISEQDANDIAAFTAAEIERPRRTLLGLPELNRVALAGVAGLLLLVVVGGTMLVARPVPMPTDEEDAA